MLLFLLSALYRSFTLTFTFTAFFLFSFLSRDLRTTVKLLFVDRGQPNVPHMQRSV